MMRHAEKITNRMVGGHMWVQLSRDRWVTGRYQLVRYDGWWFSEVDGTDEPIYLGKRIADAMRQATAELK